MLSKAEIIEFAKLNNMKPWQQEKHYIQAIILGILSEQPLVFKGGTYLWFFHGLARFSEDLDFTANEDFSDDLPVKLSNSLELFGIQNQYKIITNNDLTMSFRISAKGPLNTEHIDECRVYIEISKRENVIEKTLPLKLDFPAYTLPIKRILGLSLEEVSAEKVRAVMTRQKARDVYDLYQLIEKKNISFNKELAEKKLEYYGEKFSSITFLEKVKKKQSFFKKELNNMVFDEIPEFNTIVKKIKIWIKNTKKTKK